MANSIPDTVLTGGWTDCYAATSIPIGTSITIQNKSSSIVLLYISATIPTSQTDGKAIQLLETVTIEAGEAGCWCKGNGPIHIQSA